MKTAKMIDEEVAQLITEAKHRAMLVLKENRSFLDKLAEALLKEETLEESEVDEILKGTKLPKKLNCIRKILWGAFVVQLRK